MSRSWLHHVLDSLIGSDIHCGDKLVVLWTSIACLHLLIRLSFLNHDILSLRLDYLSLAFCQKHLEGSVVETLLLDHLHHIHLFA